VVEGLDERVELVVEARLGALEDKLGRRLESGLAEGAVASVVAGNLVEVPEDVLESGKGVRGSGLQGGHGGVVGLLLGSDVGFELLCCEDVVGRDGGG
jgi:hypothetical protein